MQCSVLKESTSGTNNEMVTGSQMTQYIQTDDYISFLMTPFLKVSTMLQVKRLPTHSVNVQG